MTFAINTIWGNAGITTITLHRHLKQHKPTETYLFYLLPQDIPTDIYFLASGLEHRDKLKAFITKINILCNPIFFTIPKELWAPYHNFSVYGSCYNNYYYTWAHRLIPTSIRSHYQHIFASYYTVIETLTQRHPYFNKTAAACQHITWDENSSVPYFIQTILDS